MSLENLVKTGQLKTHQTNADEIGRLLAAASRNLEDSRAEVISDETRFDAAYKAIMQCAMLSLNASGYRPSTNALGHHQTMIQCLELTMEVPPKVWRVLDVLRRKRHVNDYSGDLVESSMVTECIGQAAELLTNTRAWLRTNHPEFLTGPP